ncbi:515_t:CDS:2, partial [Acaulospora colombiana]
GGGGPRTVRRQLSSIRAYREVFQNLMRQADELRAAHLCAKNTVSPRVERLTTYKDHSSQTIGIFPGASSPLTYSPLTLYASRMLMWGVTASCRMAWPIPYAVIMVNIPDENGHESI